MRTTIFVVLFVAYCVLQSSAQLLLRTNSVADISAISLGTNLKNPSYGERLSLEESFFYRKRFNREDREKTVYNIFTIYKKNAVVGFCPYGIDIDMMSENFERSKPNTFRYRNKIRMGFKLLFETDPGYPDLPLLYYLNAEFYGSYLHLPHSARGDQTTKARKGSFMAFMLVTPGSSNDFFVTNASTKFLGYMKYNVGSAWIKAYLRQGGSITYTGLYAEFELNPKGYGKNKVESSKDTYRGITLFGGPEYQIQINRISINFGISLTTENH